MKSLTAMLFALSVSFCSSCTAQDTAPTGNAAATAPPPVTAKATCLNMVGKWKNQIGSILNIKTIDATTSMVSGEYQTAGDPNWYPLTGWVNWKAAPPPPPTKDNARLVSFTVHWGAYGSIAAWTGVCRGTDQLRTLWHLSRPNSDAEWDHIWSGADNFAPL